MKSRARKRLEFNSMMKTVREQTRTKHRALNEALDRMDALLREIGGETDGNASSAEQASNVVPLFR